MAEVNRALSRAISSGSAAVTLKEEQRKLRSSLSNLEVDHQSLLDISNIAQMVEKLSQQLRAAIDTVKCLCAGHWKISEIPLITRERVSFVAPLRANLTLQSVVLRHALRLGVTATFSLILYIIFDLPQGFWIRLTIFVILKPDLGGTFKRAFQRMGGTILGGIFAAILAATISSNLVLAILVVVNMY